jgi:hypothetical protein
MKSTSLFFIIALLAASAAWSQTSPPGEHAVSPQERATAKACEAEMRQFCAGKQGQAATECLRSNASKLSPRCKGEVSK